MIELRNRVLSSGFVVLEQREVMRTVTIGFMCIVIANVKSEWTQIPYVNQNGDSLKTTQIGDGLPPFIENNE